MTDDEAAKVAWILAQADGGCGYCVRDLTELAQELLGSRPWEQLVTIASSRSYERLQEMTTR